jgi:hypothetical protein
MLKQSLRAIDRVMRLLVVAGVVTAYYMGLLSSLVAAVLGIVAVTLLIASFLG